MRQPSRRAFLGTAALALSVGGGCLGRDTGSNDPPDATANAAGTTTTVTATTTTTSPEPARLGSVQTVGETTVAVSDLAIQDSVLFFDSDDSMALANRAGKRYVLVSVSGSESGPPPDAFSLVVDGEAVESAEFGGCVDGYGPRYDPVIASKEGYVAFVVPVGLDANAARLVVDEGGDTAAWRLGESALDALRRPKAEFELREVEIPETLLRYSPVSVRVVAANLSDVAGVFKGVLNVAGANFAYAPYPFALDAAPGETVVWEQTFAQGPSRDVESVAFFLETVAGGTEVRATVRSRNETAQGTATTTETRTNTTRIETETATDA